MLMHLLRSCVFLLSSVFILTACQNMRQPEEPRHAINQNQPLPSQLPASLTGNMPSNSMPIVTDSDTALLRSQVLQLRQEVQRLKIAMQTMQDNQTNPSGSTSTSISPTQPNSCVRTADGHYSNGLWAVDADQKAIRFTVPSEIGQPNWQPDTNWKSALSYALRKASHVEINSIGANASNWDSLNARMRATAQYLLGLGANPQQISLVHSSSIDTFEPNVQAMARIDILTFDVASSPFEACTFAANTNEEKSSTATPSAISAPNITTATTAASTPPTTAATAQSTDKQDLANSIVIGLQPNTLAPAPKTVVDKKELVITAATPAANNNADIQSFVESWAQAWSTKNIKAYLDAYGLTFDPDQYSSRAEWEKDRTEKIQSKRKISVRLENIHIDRDGAKAQVRFVQHYRGDGFVDISKKTLQLIQSDGHWRIVKETEDDAS